MTKALLTDLDNLRDKYGIDDNDYQQVRARMKSELIGYNNIWVLLFMAFFEADWGRKLNPDGEKMETHLVNGNHIS